jgi:hypothetical protein
LNLARSSVERTSIRFRQPVTSVTTCAYVHRRIRLSFSFTGLPAPVFDYLRPVKTHAILNAPMTPVRRQFPIVRFSHGPLSGNRSQSVFQNGSARQPRFHRRRDRSHGVCVDDDLSGWTCRAAGPARVVAGVRRCAVNGHVTR